MIQRVDISGFSREEWLAERRKDLGGSEISAILGMNPYESAYSVWAKKTGRIPVFEGNLRTEVGTALEQFVADKFADVSGYGKAVQKTKFLFRNDAYPCLHALPDRLIHASSGPKSPVVAGLECKTTSAFNTKRFKGIDFPEQYYAQCVQYMGVLEIPVWYLAVLVGNAEIHYYRLVKEGHNIPYEEWLDGSVTVDNTEFPAMVEAANEFWSHINDDEFSGVVDGSRATEDTLDALYDEKSNGEEMEDPTYEMTCYVIADLKEQKAAIEKKIAEQENALKARMGEYERMRAGHYTVSWKPATRNTIDSKALRKDLPEIADKYTKTSVSRTFSIKEVK